MSLQKCARCEHEYPEDILSPMAGAIVTGEICGICAREIRKAVHGVDIPFSRGSHAQFLEQEAIFWRKKNGIPL